MERTALERAARENGGKILAALAARFRDLDIAEDALGEAFARAAAAWPAEGAPRDPAAWLYRTAYRAAIDAMRRRAVRDRLQPDPPGGEPTAEDAMIDDSRLIPDERLRLIFVCCHPAVAAEARAALTLRLVCGLTTREIASAFLMTETALAQRLVRAKRKIAGAGVPFSVPAPEAWGERLEAVLSTLEIAYAKAHEDAAGAGPHAGYATEMLELTRVLAVLLPGEGEVQALAALVRYADARRPARLDGDGAMTPLSEQDPARWNRDRIEDGDRYLHRARNLGAFGPRALNAAIHGAWCARPSLTAPAPWPVVLRLYDAMLSVRDDVVVRLNRAVALAETAGPQAALDEVLALGDVRLENFLPYHAVRADLLRRVGRREESRAAYDAALALSPPPAERAWLERVRASLD
jgi:RNA polymerase sigma-70 factor (ECF subfamily)